MGGHSDLTPSQISVVLRFEKDGSATVSSLARAEGMRPQSMSAIVTPLQEVGLVRGAAGPERRAANSDVSHAQMPEVASGGQGRETGLAHHDHHSQKLSAHEQQKLQAHSNCFRGSLRIEPVRPALAHANFAPASYSRLRIQEKNPMPLTTLDPNTALIVIDLQKGIVNGNFIHPIADIIDRTRALIDVFRAKNLPSRAGQCGGTAAGPDGAGSAQPIYRCLRDGPTYCRSWISNRATLSSPSEAGAHSQQPILNTSSRREALPRWL
jgi:hypothetical protein